MNLFKPKFDFKNYNQYFKILNGQIVESVKYKSWHNDVFVLDAQQMETLKEKKTLTLVLNLPDLIDFHKIEKSQLKLQNKINVNKLTQKNLDLLNQITQIKTSKMEVEKNLSEASRIATDEKMDLEERKSQISKISMDIEKHVNFNFVILSF